jgi:hypothetical protein
LFGHPASTESWLSSGVYLTLRLSDLKVEIHHLLSGIFRICQEVALPVAEPTLLLYNALSAFVTIKHKPLFVVPRRKEGPAMSNSNVKRLFIFLVGVLLVSSCQSPVPTEAQIATSASSPAQPSGAFATPTTQSSVVPPTEQATLTPTPSVLPDGRLLLVVGWASGGKYPDTDVDFFEQYRWLELSSMTVTPHSLLTGDYPIQDNLVTLSPDLAHLALVRDTWSKIETAGNTYDAATSRSVLLANPDGDQATPIGQPIGQGEAVNHVMGCGDEPSWSANSHFFAFARTPDWTSREKEHHLYLYEVASGKLNTVTIHSQQELGAFALSPDGAQIAITEIESSPEIALNIHLMNADGSNDRVLVKGWISSNLVWHPDGTRIFFKSDRIDDLPNPGIYSVDVATGVTTLLTPVSERAWCLALSPDGSLLTYDDGGIMAVTPEGGEPRPFLGTCNVRYVSRRVWSPDNQYVAFVGGPIPNTQIFIMDRAGNCQALEYHEDQMVPWYPIGWLP